MSLSTRIRGRRWRTASAIVASAALVLTTAGIAAADQIAADGDDIKVGNNISYGTSDSTGQRACSTRGTGVPGTATITYQGGPSTHLAAGEALEVEVTNPTAGITVDVDSSDLTLPSTWTTGSSHPIDITTTVATSVPNATYTIKLRATGLSSDKTTANEASYTVTITGCTITSTIVDTDGDTVPDADDNCPNVANTNQANADGDALGDACDANSYAPAVGTDAGNTSGDEGSQQTNSGSFTDADGNGSLSITGAGAGVVTDNGDGTWSWALTPADEGSGTVTVTASDGEHADAVDTFDWSADNVNPIVAAPDFSTASVDCRNAITLTGISFSDPGINDDPWTVSIDWGDGSTDDSYSTNDQGAQGNQSHTYNTPGTYTATVTVTDEDGGEGSNTSSSSVTVQQTYAVDFLAPFDDSSPSGLIVNKMKNGRVVPVKVTIYDECALAAVTDPATAVTIATSKTSGTGTGDPVETYADAGQSSADTNRFRWSSDGFWIYNLDSKALGLVVSNNYRVDAYVGAVKATQDTWAVLQPVK